LPAQVGNDQDEKVTVMMNEVSRKTEKNPNGLKMAIEIWL
jgi:hypothetical protein